MARAQSTTFPDFYGQEMITSNRLIRIVKIKIICSSFVLLESETMAFQEFISLNLTDWSDHVAANSSPLRRFQVCLMKVRFPLAHIHT